MSGRGISVEQQEARRVSRLGAVQALYQMDLGGTPTEEVIEEFVTHRFGTTIEEVEYPEADVEFFGSIVRGVVGEQIGIDRQIESVLADGWTMTRIDSTARALLRCAGFELLSRPDVPVKTIMNEYIEVSHAFFEGKEPAFINGVVDKMAHILREDEISAK